MKRVLMIMPVIGIVVFGAVLLAGCSSPGGSMAYRPVSPTDYHLQLSASEALSVGCYERVELGIVTNVPVQNPFDYNEIAMRVHFTAPTGEIYSVGAFWSQDFDPQSLAPTGDPGWRVRFSPPVTGTWSAYAEITDLELRSETISFQVKASSSPGFLRVSDNNSRYLAFDDGTPFFMVGTNICWSRNADVLGDYQTWFDAFSQNGGNTTRVWMAPWSFALEWEDTPLGDYNQRMRQAWLLDQVFEMAEARDIYIFLVLINHGQFSERVNPEWAHNPYNATLGGPLVSPEEFVTNDQARELFKRRLYYIVNRWGYSTNLLAWEWWNEVNWTPIGDQQLETWLVEMSAFLRAYDINQHLLTNSYAGNSTSATWQLPEMDIVQKHEYNTRDLAQTARLGYKQLADRIPQKPIAFTEFGYITEEENTTSIDKEGIHLHNGLWASTFSGYAGTAMYWWWDTYIAPLNLWHHFSALAEFIAAADISMYTPSPEFEILGPDGGAAGATGLSLRQETAVWVWLRNREYTAQSVMFAYEDALRDGAGETFVFEPSLVESHTLLLEGLLPGDYQVQWFDPQTGNWLSESVVVVESKALSLAIPSFKRDLAVKVVLVQ